MTQKVPKVTNIKVMEVSSYLIRRLGDLCDVYVDRAVVGQDLWWIQNEGGSYLGTNGKWKPPPHFGTRRNKKFMEKRRFGFLDAMKLLKGATT